MHRERTRADDHVREAARDLLSEPAVRILLSGSDQPPPAGKHRAAGTSHRAGKRRSAARCNGQYEVSTIAGVPKMAQLMPSLKIISWERLVREGAVTYP